jgi:hypothetical protein
MSRRGVCPTKTSTSTPSTFLSLPTELRQKILRYTVTDKELKYDISARWIGWKHVPYYEHCYAKSWTIQLTLLHYIIAYEMPWVEERWIERGEALAREEKKTKIGKKGARLNTSYGRKSCVKSL